MLICGLLLPILFGFGWLVLLRFFAKTIIYCALIGIGVGLWLLTLYLFIVTGMAQELLADLLASNATQALLSSAVSAAGDLQSAAGDLGYIFRNRVHAGDDRLKLGTGAPHKGDAVGHMSGTLLDQPFDLTGRIC